MVYIGQFQLIIVAEQYKPIKHGVPCYSHSKSIQFSRSKLHKRPNKTVKTLSDLASDSFFRKISIFRARTHPYK